MALKFFSVFFFELSQPLVGKKNLLNPGVFLSQKNNSGNFFCKKTYSLIDSNIHLSVYHFVRGFEAEKQLVFIDFQIYKRSVFLLL